MTWYMETSNVYNKNGVDEMLCNKAFIIVGNPTYDWYQCGMTSMVYNFLNKKAGYSNHIITEICEIEEFVNELNSSINRKCEMCKEDSSFRDNI